MTAEQLATVAPPVRDAVRRVARLARDAVTGIVHDFLWVSVRDGVIRLRGFSRAMQAVVLVASAAYVVAIAAFAVGDVLRTSGDLLVIQSGLTGRGSLVPAALLPVTFVLLALGSALALAGALHATLPARLGVLVVYLSVAVSFQGLAVTLQDTAGTTVWHGWLLIGLVPAVFVARWRARPRPAAEFAVLLVLVAGAMAISEHALLRSDELSGGSFAIRQLSLVLVQLVSMSVPLLFVAGLDVIAFGAKASAWVLDFVDRRVTAWAVYAGLAALGAWRAKDLLLGIVAAVGDDGAGDALLPVLGAAILVASLWAYRALLGRMTGAPPGARPGEDEVAHGAALVRMPLAAAYSGTVLLLLAAQLVLLAGVGLFGDLHLTLIDVMNEIISFAGDDRTVTTYRIGVGLVLALVGVRLARRSNATLGMFLGAVGLSDVLATSFAEIDALHPLLWSDAAPVDLVWTSVFLGAAVWWVVGRRLTEVRAERLFFLVLLAGLLSQWEFAADPFGPLLGFAGMGFVVFGLVWGFLTGGGWANEASERFPRSSRTFLLLGYSIFSIALLNWFSASHDIDQLASFEGFGANGVHLLGYPLLYALFTLGLSGAVADRPIDRPPTDPVPAVAPAVDEPTPAA